MEDIREIQSISQHAKEYWKLDNAASVWWNPNLPWYQAQLNTVMNTIEAKNKHIVDIGTGNGRFSVYFAKAGAQSIVAVDISKKMLELAKENASADGVVGKIKFVQADAEALDFLPAEMFDVAICMEIFVTLPNPLKALNGIKGLLKAEGIIVANIDSPLTKSWYFRLLHNRSLYYSLPLGLRRHVFHKYFRLPVFPPSGEEKKRPKQLPTTQETIQSLNGNFEVKLFRAEDCIHNMSKKKFMKLFEEASLEIFKVARVGYWFCPRGYIVFARKT
jgi:ubiquinone/menaquinone biosynthesis C-methylase UbiE